MALAGCAPQTFPAAGPPSPPERGAAGSAEELADPDPSFAAHFTDPIYDDPAGEFAPFGSDEGADLLAEWSERRDELDADSTVAELIGTADGAAEIFSLLDARDASGVPLPGEGVDAATIIVGAAFTLLRLTGHIDAPGREHAMRALDVLIDRYGPQEDLLRQRQDLDAWRR
ncbi:hypothetical protein AVP41_01158 [Microbacterium sp. TNHR37B]|nr:hypothetical protein AVP41_01158 [Microbacterium sp. TNHR37B]